MKAIRFHEYGGPDELRYEDAPLPVPGEGQVRLRVAASAFNPVDDGIRCVYLRDVFPVALPHVPGSDVAGTVDAIGAGVTGFDLGDRVVGFLPMQTDGAAAEYALAPADVLAKAPTTIPLADAAALPSVALTAWQALFDDAGLKQGQRVLVNGAGGAVGGYALQLAKRAGAYVIATASPRSEARVRQAGADEIVDHTTTSLAAAVTEPVDVLLNLARVLPDETVALVRPGGVVVNTVPTVAIAGAEDRDVRVVGVFVRSDAGQLAQLVDLVDRGELRVDIAERVALADLPDVHARADAGTLSGKVIAIP